MHIHTTNSLPLVGSSHIICHAHWEGALDPPEASKYVRRGTVRPSPTRGGFDSTYPRASREEEGRVEPFGLDLRIFHTSDR